MSADDNIPPNIVLVFDGDSLTDGVNNAGSSQYYPNRVNNNIDVVYGTKEFYSYGVSGQSTRQMLADRATQIYPKATAGKINILVAWEEANAILRLDNGYNNSLKVTAEENFADMQTYFEGAKLAGFQHCILITGYYPRKSISGDYEIGSYKIYPSSVDEMEVYLNLVTDANIEDMPWDYHIDLRTAPNIGGVKGQLENATYFNDYIHLQALGYNEIATIITEKINEILTPSFLLQEDGSFLLQENNSKIIL